MPRIVNQAVGKGENVTTHDAKRSSTEQIKVLVAGAGGAGIAAALALAEGGAKVEVFEKMAKGGGTTDFAEGIYSSMPSSATWTFSARWEG